MKIKNNPVCAFISVLIIIIFSLYTTSALKTIPCEKDMISIFISNFIHIDTFHLMANLYGIYSLSKIEILLGSKKFLILVLFLSIFNTVFESILHKIINTPCSIGMSGILYGVITFEILLTKEIDYNGLFAVFLNIYASSISNTKSSLSAHIIGAISGILGSIILKQTDKLTL